MPTDKKRPFKSEQNPLFSANIPAAPPITEVASPPPDEPENGNRAIEQQSIGVSEHQGIRGREGKEKATVELSLYLHPAHDDKLEDLRRDYKRRTGKKISANEVIRRLIDQASLEMLLERGS